MDSSSLHATIDPPDGDLGKVTRAIAGLVDSQRGGDENYFRDQLPRYLRTCKRIQELVPARGRALDIGSHYLHQSVLLSELGFEVTGVDVELFTSAAFVKERAATFNIRNATVNALEAGDFLAGQDGQFDLIVFTEILEHITFNPIRFWRRVHELMSPAALIYVSTPNALRPVAWCRQLMRLLAFRGIGLSLDEIMENVTYGHHWKEYSASEIRRYFAMLSSDFIVTTDWYSSDLGGGPGFKTDLKRLLAAVPCLRSDIEAVIRCSKRAGFAARAPQLRMQQSAMKGGD